MLPLDWKPIPQDAGGPLFPVLYQAAADGGTLALAVHDRQRGAGAGLTAVPAAITGSLAWRRLESSHGGPPYPDLFGAEAAGGTLVAAVQNTAGEDPAAGAGAALAFVAAPVVGRLDFRRVTQNRGAGFPELFCAALPQGALLVAVHDPHNGVGVGLAWVTAPVRTLGWSRVDQSHGGPRFPRAFAAPAPGGMLVLADLEREAGTGAGLALVSGAVARLDWEQLDQVQGGPRFPRHFHAPAEGGGLFLSLFDKPEGAGVDLAYLAGG